MWRGRCALHLRVGPPGSARGSIAERAQERPAYLCVAEPELRSAPDVRLLTLQPWDKTIIGAIEKAILASELGLNPQSDGTLIRLPIPQLTEERRKDLVKVVKRLGEEAKVAVRNIRRDGNDKIKKLEKKHEISEDNMHTNQEEIQKLTDKYIAKVDETVQAKEKEIMEL